MDINRYPKIAMYGYVHGQRGRGRPRKRWMDMVQKYCEAMEMTTRDVPNIWLDPVSRWILAKW